MDLRHLRLDRERKLANGPTEIWTGLDPEIEARLDWKAASGPPAVIRRLLLLGQAVKTLSELKKIAPKIFLLSNDGLDTWPSPYDFGNLSQKVLDKYSWKSVRRGFDDEGKFSIETGFDNFVIESDDGTFTDFVSGYMGGHLPPIRYLYCFANERIKIADIVDAVQSSSNEVGLINSLCEVSEIVSYGLEEDAYVFFTSREAIASAIRNSLSKGTIQIR